MLKNYYYRINLYNKFITVLTLFCFSVKIFKCILNILFYFIFKAFQRDVILSICNINSFKINTIKCMRITL